MALLPARPSSASYERAAERQGLIRRNLNFRKDDFSLHADRFFQIHQEWSRQRPKNATFSDDHAVGHVFLVRHLHQALCANEHLGLTSEEKAHLESVLGWTYDHPSVDELETRIASVDWFRENQGRGSQIFVRLREEVARLQTQDELFKRKFETHPRAIDAATYTLFSNPLMRWSHNSLGTLKMSLAAKKQAAEERRRKDQPNP